MPPCGVTAVSQLRPMPFHADDVARGHQDVAESSLQGRVDFRALHDGPDVCLFALQSDGFQQGFGLNGSNDVAMLAVALALDVRLAPAQQL